MPNNHTLSLRSYSGISTVLEAYEVCHNISIRDSFELKLGNFKEGYGFFGIVICYISILYTPIINLWSSGASKLSFSQLYMQAHHNNLEMNYSGTSLLWLLAGDFNKIRSLDARDRSNNEMVRGCPKFSNWIDSKGLVDLVFWVLALLRQAEILGSPKKRACLDSGLFNIQWRTQGAVPHLVQNYLEHCPILISLSGFASISEGIRPFKFQAASISHEHSGA
ncbi:LOW QUALITY PROTEIN: hypothetical protein Cgig2_030446 [Carnegiea gigantea]|uniref:Uncharacterized protein n=1 Tax=Carnegiea gigantea TaxID=171969 RepID=A0A9Q1KP29_9CARY|nr:LOW QUALITY PROTEIN: hypothetical protein Cgig2_030446 [Carnegiea gigantea]